MSDSRQLANDVLTLPYWSKADPEQSAWLILPGVQEDRIFEGAKYWLGKAKHLWVAGTRGDPFYTRKEILNIILNATDKDVNDDLENGGWENNTPDQMRWTIELLKKNQEVNHLVICTAAYHIPRAVLTCVKMMQKHDTTRVISVMPLLHSKGPSIGSVIWEQEMEKIPKYQQTGDVAPLSEWKKYCSWRASQ